VDEVQAVVGEVDSRPEDLNRVADSRLKKKEALTIAKPATARTPESQTAAAPSTGGTTEPNDQPYGDVFYREYGVNPFIDTEDDNLSTFGLDVDTGSYTVARRYLRDGHLPPREAIRVEEFVNSFDYGDRPPRRGDFRLAAEGAPAPFAAGERYYLLRFAVSARQVAAKDRPPAVLTFVVDTSGSMNRENRLGLVKSALYELLDHLRSDDRVGLVVYGSRGEVLLEPTTDHEAIRSAIGRLHGGGSTNAEEGLLLAYELADEYRDRDGINRIILCSDGVANVGRTGPESILERIEHFTEEGIELTTVGFGMGNYNDVLMEQLADTGDGRYAYVDALPEARRILVEELTGTLMTIGSEAKAQVEFNPGVVSRYRLLGYENRDIADERFRDPTVDAGEIGSGHTVAALYDGRCR
jgi:Ca-activated chloride channel family protein